MTIDATWAVTKFEEYWADPAANSDISHLSPELVGRWPDGTVVRGVREYVEIIVRIQQTVPDIRFEMLESAVNGELAFIRWRGYGTGRLGAFEFFGVNRLRTEGNVIKENIVHFDMDTFNTVAGTPFPT